jgi:hypothetical protein
MTAVPQPPVAGGHDRTPATRPRPAPVPVTLEDRLAAVEKTLAAIADEYARVTGTAAPGGRPALTVLQGGKR